MSNDVAYYERDGKRRHYDRITRILDYFAPPELVAWKMRVGKREAGRISREAMKIGSNVDECIRSFVREEKSLPKLKTLEAKNCWEAFNQWRNDYNPGQLGEMHTVFNEELGVAGTPDLYWPSENCIIDIKCSSAIRLSYWLQTEFYCRCYKLPVKAILRLDKNLGIYEFKKMSLSDEHWAATVGLINAYRILAVKDGEQKEESDERNTNDSTIGATDSAV